MQAFSRKNIFGYSFLAFSSLAIAIIGFLGVGHHIFVAGQSVYAGMNLLVLSFVVAIPSAIKVFNVTRDDLQGRSASTPDAVCRLVSSVTVHDRWADGALPRGDGSHIHVHDTYFVVAHFHYIMVGAAIMGSIVGLHYCAEITWAPLPEGWAMFAALMVFVGFN